LVVANVTSFAIQGVVMSYTELPIASMLCYTPLLLLFLISSKLILVLLNQQIIITIRIKTTWYKRE
jgi:hypothetical protein